MASKSTIVGLDGSIYPIFILKFALVWYDYIQYTPSKKCETCGNVRNGFFLGTIQENTHSHYKIQIAYIICNHL